MVLIRTCIVLSAAALVVVLIGIGISLSNQSLRRQVNDRQQIINQGLTFSEINIRLANALATLAIRDHDDKARRVLSEHGVTLNPNWPPPIPAEVSGGSR